MSDMRDSEPSSGTDGLTRRKFLQVGGAGAAALAAGGLLEACGGSSASTTPSTAKPKRGGALTVAVLGGTASDTLDADAEVNTADLIRMGALYNGLVKYTHSGSGVMMDLAEEFTPNSDATQWTIRVRPDVTFHNGKTLTAEDVMFTIRRIANPKAPLNGFTVLSNVDLNNMQKLDSRTVRLHMKQPYATLPLQLFPAYNYGIVPVGYDPKRPVGTGPFKYESFTPAVRSVFVRNENYWKSGLPYLDKVTIDDSYTNDTTAFSALQAGNIDVYCEASFSIASSAGKSSGLKAVVSDTGQWIPFTMRVDSPPFNDVRVRQAFRYIVDRPRLVTLAFNGFAAPGNDIFGQHDPAYQASLQRSQDIEKAKSLLKQAGHAGLTVQLVTSDIAAGAVNCAQVFAQQAKAAGVTVNLRNVPSTVLFGPSYKKWTFAQDYWDYNPYLSQVAQATLPNSPFNETHFNNARYNSLYRQANATLDNSKRTELIHEMQDIDFNEGGYIIAAYNKIVDLMSNSVNGFPSGAGAGLPLGNLSWETAWLS